MPDVPSPRRLLHALPAVLLVRKSRFAIACACLATAAAAQQPPADPLAGRWELNVARTHYGGGADPRQREAFICTTTAAGVDCTIESTRSDGRVVVGGFAGTYGGAPAPTRGIPGVDHVRLARIDASIADATFTSQGRPVFAYRAVRSADGRSLTIISVDPDSRAVLNSVVVYDRR
jgi:hypothetical protein